MDIPAYRIIISQNPETQSFVAWVPELPGCRVEAGSYTEAMDQLMPEIEAQIANLAASGKTLPEPVETTDYSGEITIKVSTGLHRDLAWQAAIEGVDVGELLTELVSSALEFRRSRRPPRRAPAEDEPQEGAAHPKGGRRRGRDRLSKDRYHKVMDDRASFIEYVRGLDGGKGQGGGGGGRRGSRGRKKGQG